MSREVVIGNIKTQQDIEILPKIVLKSDYSCKIKNGPKFAPTEILGSSNKRIYTVCAGDLPFEDTINKIYGVPTEKVWTMSSCSEKRFIEFKGFGRTRAFSTWKDAENYIIVVLRYLMQMCVTIEVDDWDDSMISRLKEYGLTICPYGNKSLLSPDLSKFENQSYDYENTSNDNDDILNIRINHKRKLNIDFKE